MMIPADTKPGTEVWRVLGHVYPVDPQKVSFVKMLYADVAQVITEDGTKKKVKLYRLYKAEAEALRARARWYLEHWCNRKWAFTGHAYALFQRAEQLERRADATD